MEKRCGTCRWWLGDVYERCRLGPEATADGACGSWAARTGFKRLDGGRAVQDVSKEEIARALENCGTECGGCPYDGREQCAEDLRRDAARMLRERFSANEVFLWLQLVARKNGVTAFRPEAVRRHLKEAGIVE